MSRAKLVGMFILLAGSAYPATGANLIRNAGFESGDLKDWDLSGNQSFSGVSGFEPMAGAFAAFLGPSGTSGSLAQTLATSAGDQYEISFWLRNEIDGGNVFQVSFDGMPLLLDLRAQAAFAFRRYSFVRTATSSAATLRFTYRHDPSYWHLDEISVTRLGAAIPEPATWATMIGGLGLVGAAYRRRRVRPGRLGMRAVAC